MIVPGAVLLCASPAFGVELREQFKPRSTPIRKSARRSPTGWPPRKSGSRPKACGIRAFRSKARPACASLRNPTRRTHRHRRRDAVADRRRHHRRPAAVQQRRPRGGDPPPGGAHRRRRGARRGALRIRRAQRRRAYIDYLLQQRLVAIAQDNATFHERLAGDLREGVSKGSISIADQQQAEERLQSARARVTEAREDLDTAAITFQTLTGVPIDSVSMPPDLSQCMPASLPEAEELARQNNPRVQEAIADLDTAREEIAPPRPSSVRASTSKAAARAGHDIDGFAGPHHRPAGARRAALEPVQRRHQGRPTSANSSAAPTKCMPACSSGPAGPRKTSAPPGAASTTRAGWSASSRRRAGSPTTCCCPIASSSTSAAVRCSTCSTRRTRATMSRRRPRPRGWPSSMRNIACWRRPTG